MNFTEDQHRFCAMVRVSPRETSPRLLVDLFVPQSEDDSAALLQRLGRLERVLDVLNFQASPSLSEGGSLDSPMLVSVKQAETTVQMVLTEVAQDEDQHLEFKSSFTCSIKSYRAKPGLEPKHYKNEGVEDSALSAMAGLMNGGGGVLLIGVEDSGEIIGLEPDFHALCVTGTDRWLQYVRAKILHWFVDGRSITTHINVSFVEIDGKVVARVTIRPRPKLTFLGNIEMPSCPPRLLLRVGNQTIEVKAADLEDFFEQRLRARAIESLQ